MNIGHKFGFYTEIKYICVLVTCNIEIMNTYFNASISQFFNSKINLWNGHCKINLILIIFSLGSIDQVFSQNTPLLYEIVSSSSVSLSHDDSVYYHNIISSPSVVDYQFIKLMNVIHNQDE